MSWFDNLQLLPGSPCPNMFGYENDGYSWYGVILVPNPPNHGSLTIKVKLSLAANLPTKYVGKLELYGDKAVTMRKIMKGHSAKYKVNFPLSAPLPTLVSLVFNNRLLCSGPPASGNTVTSIDLQHILHLDNQPNQSTHTTQAPITYQSTSAYQQPEIYQEPQYQNKQPQPQTMDDNSICGTTSVDQIPLIVKGQTVDRGEWPWLVAIYRKTTGSLEFTCGATLISKKRVLTAAHCVTDSQRQAIGTHNIMLRLGVHNIDDWSDGNAVYKSVVEIRLKDFFKDFKFSNDIAILIMSEEVVYSDLIRPVCLWDGETNQNQIHGKDGFVVGWGKDEEGSRTTSEPKMIKVPIVSTTTCRASNPKLFYLTSEKTLCAGSKEGAGPCTGDSGGGMYMKQRGKWVIRGIVSSALKGEDNSCDLNQYVIYTDCTQFLSWMQQP